MFLRNIFEALARTGEGKAAVVGWGRGMGHKGHMMLASSVITHANQLSADPYFVVSRTVGKDDPITPDEKLAIYKKVFPEQGHIFQTATDEIPDLTRVLSDLNRQGYTSATIVLGADQVKAFQYLKNYNGKADKAGNVPYTFDKLDVISRQETSDPSRDQEGPRATPMRAVLMDPSKSEQEQFQVWRDAMNPQVSDDEVRDLMMKAKERMQALVKPKKGVAEGAKDQQIPTKVQKRSEWQKTPLSSNTIVVDGYTIRFTPNALIISKGGKVLWKKDGDYSRPTNSTLVSAKKLVTGLSRQGQPDEKQMFGKVDPEELKSRKDHRKKWQQASNLSHERKISFQQAWSQLFGDDVSESDSTVIAQTTKRLTDPKDGATTKLRAAGDKRREDQLKGRDIAKNDRTSKDEWGDLKELSNDLLGRYKKAAAVDANAADKAGDTKRADKRFSGIVKATKKQFANDEKDMNEFASGDDGEDPTDNYPCYDCGSTIFLHHTELCELAEENAIRDLPAKPGSQHWTGEIPKGLHPIPGLAEDWSQKYKSSINCNNPKGFSQKAHCAGKKKEEDVEEGLGSKLAGLGLAGAMALGAGGANARVVPGQDDPNINRLTGKPNVTQVVPGNVKPAAATPAGFNKEYLQSVIDGKHPRPMISKEKAAELLMKMNTVDEAKQRLDPNCWKDYRKQGTKMKGGVRVNNCVKVSEGVEDIMDTLINKIIVNEAIQNNRK